MAMRNRQIYCSFCGRSSREVLVFPGPNDANICADCATHITDAVAEAEKASAYGLIDSFVSPKKA